MSKRRVVVTGLGALTPLGNSVSETWERLLACESGIDYIKRFDTEGFNVKIGGELKNLAIEDYLDRKEARRMDPFMQYGIIACMQAAQDAGLESLSEDQRKRTGVAMGSGIGGIEMIEHVRETFSKSGPRKVSPFFVPSAIINMISGNVAIKYGFKGPNIAVVTACTTGTHNIGYAARTIAYGDADVMLAGGAEMATTPVAVAGFSNAKALSARNDDPKTASRPWDTGRDGFVLSDGAACVVLEEYEHAKAREATIYAELSGFGMSDDAFHITSPAEDGEGAFTSMQNALNDAGIAPEEVDYINAHGTSTPLGDVAEAQAIQRLFSNSKERLLVSSTKSSIGHLLGAAGAIEATFCVLAMKNNVAPPTINVENKEPSVELDIVATAPREAKISTALSNSFGFGGTNGTLIFKSV